MDIVVTGGSGFVGRVLIPKLLTSFKNSKIINLDKNPYKLPNKNFSTIQTTKLVLAVQPFKRVITLRLIRMILVPLVLKQ